MLIILSIILILRTGQCKDAPSFDTKTVRVGEPVTLTCIRDKSWFGAHLFWIRLAFGKFPEVLGGTHYFDYNVSDTTPHFTAKQEPGSFVLHIKETEMSDSGVYCCLKADNINMTVLNATCLKIKGTDPDINAVIQTFPSDPVRPGISVTLRCSVLIDSEDKLCPGEDSVFWFRARSDGSHPSFIHAHGNSGDDCVERGSPQSCVYNISKHVSSSDAGTYYCAVASCGEIWFGNGSKLNIEGSSTQAFEVDTVVPLLSAALAVSLIVIAFLIYNIKKKTCHCCKAATVSADQPSQQRDEDLLVYSAPNFTKRNFGDAGERPVRAAETESTYACVRA
ncbi:uncharacterized protein LOC142999432 isoform X3 [Genypterus blacodes]|uniref:uncharacterized protein LOC142999432 isoform X3 n=1 Tax=Genypterus blacodes TaxID=154954 RepID=UPI003F762323